MLQCSMKQDGRHEISCCNVMASDRYNGHRLLIHSSISKEVKVALLLQTMANTVTRKHDREEELASVYSLEIRISWDKIRAMISSQGTVSVSIHLIHLSITMRPPFFQ